MCLTLRLGALVAILLFLTMNFSFTNACAPPQGYVQVQPGMFQAGLPGVGQIDVLIEDGPGGLCATCIVGQLSLQPPATGAPVHLELADSGRNAGCNYLIYSCTRTDGALGVGYTINTNIERRFLDLSAAYFPLFCSINGQWLTASKTGADYVVANTIECTAG